MAATHPSLIVLRGNSGSGKSTLAVAVRARSAAAVALVEQDYLRRTVLDEPGDTAAAGGTAAHPGRTHAVYLDIPLDETIRRHAGRVKAEAFSSQDMKDWYHPTGCPRLARRARPGSHDEL
jgi:chloramphenicol 3-O-phosphotransferase